MSKSASIIWGGLWPLENMIKRTIYFGNPAYLSVRNAQLEISRPSADENVGKTVADRTIPIEDVGMVILDHRQITVTSSVFSSLLENNAAVITCDEKSMPTGLLLPLHSHTLQSERFKEQLEASLPLRKQLWQQTIEAKIRNQASVLKYVHGEEAKNMLIWSDSVKSGDADNMEARAAAFYWKSIFPELEYFTRDRDGQAPNNLLNYGYAILRAILARALVGSGLLTTLGIHHHNRYNAYCLADDIMEPYRPYVDKLVVDLLNEHPCPSLNREIKARLLEIPVLDVVIDGHRSPLMIAASTTSASLYKCFSGVCRKILYPVL